MLCEGHGHGPLQVIFGISPILQAYCSSRLSYTYSSVVAVVLSGVQPRGMAQRLRVQAANQQHSSLSVNAGNSL